MRVLWHGASLIVALALGGCAFDYEVSLPNGYRLIRANRHEVVIANSQQLVVVEGKVERYGTVGEVVVGYLVYPDWPNPQPSQTEGVRPGYFILDTTDGSTEKGLSQNEWMKRLTARGLTPPSLDSVRHPLIPWLG